MPWVSQPLRDRLWLRKACGVLISHVLQMTFLQRSFSMLWATNLAIFLYVSYLLLHLRVFLVIKKMFGVLEPLELRRFPKSVFYAETNFAGGEATESSNWLSALVHRSLEKFQHASAMICWFAQFICTFKAVYHFICKVCMECHCDENQLCRLKQRRLGVFCWGLAHEPSEVDLWC